MAAAEFTITRSIQSRSWPAASANLEFAAVWGTVNNVPETVPRFSDDIRVRRISNLLEPAGRAEGIPVPLPENAGTAFIGCYVLGMGFVVSPAEAQEWIAADARNAEVLFPYLNGEDLNSRPDSTGSRWIIDFNDWDEARAARYERPFQRITQLVKPERQRMKPDGSYVLRRPLPERWWQYAEKRPAMRAAIADLGEVLVIARVSKTVMPLRVQTGQIMSEACVVFATGSYGDQAVLSSSLHQIWAITYGSGMRSDPRYTPSDVFETFSRPLLTPELHDIGRRLDGDRREIMLRRGLGLTRLYNLVNDSSLSSSADSDVAKLRALHVELDQLVVDGYGWSGLELQHGFHSHRKMERWTVSPTARAEILDLLLDENNRRAGADCRP